MKMTNKVSKTKISIVTVAWGKAFAEKWLNGSFLTYFAPNNIPYLLSQGYQVDFLICSDMESQKVIIDFIGQNKIEGINLKFIDIQYILNKSPNYGVTLTKAFHAAVRSYGLKSLKRYFIFLNADFFISGSLFKGLAQRIQNGQEVVMGYSLRVHEEVLDIIKKKYSKLASINVPEREAINIFLKHKHPTVNGQIYGTHLFFAIQHQIYFPLTKDEFICYHILRSPLLVKPSKIAIKPKGYFDFSFVHEVAPNATIHWISESDEGVILELESPTKEVICVYEREELDFRIRFEYFRKAINALHKWNALQPIHLYSKNPEFKELPKKYEAAFREYKEMILEITPFPLLNHYFWKMTKKRHAYKERLIEIVKKNNPNIFYFTKNLIIKIARCLGLLKVLIRGVK